MKTLDMYQYIEDEVCRHLDLFDLWFSKHTFCELSRPEVIFAPLTVDAAQCMYTWDGPPTTKYVIGNIVFNAHMIPLNFDRYITDVVPHETGHWCHAVLHGYVNDEDQNLQHGSQWKQLMKFFEADDSPTIHDLKSPMVDGLYQYGCGCSTINLDHEEKLVFAEDLYCPKCECEYKFIPKDSK